jgi:hypothetical protein
LEQTKGRPWGYVSLDEHTGNDSPYRDLSVKGQYDAWWRIVSDPVTVFTIFRDLPWAWDGAINFQVSLGNADKGMFDMEPLVVVYSQMGLPGQP